MFGYYVSFPTSYVNCVVSFCGETETREQAEAKVKELRSQYDDDPLCESILGQVGGIALVANGVLQSLLSA